MKILFSSFSRYWFTGKYFPLVLAVVLIAFFPSEISAQLSEGGLPYSFSHQLSDSVPAIIFPRVDRDELLRQDSIEQSKGVPFRFGFSHDASINMDNSGRWDILPSGDKLWRLTIVCPEAISVNLLYNHYYLPEGAKFYIYNSSKTEIIGAFTKRNNKDDGLFATGVVRGDTMHLEYYEPSNAEFQGSISISNVIHGYSDIFKEIARRNDFGTSGSCNINVNCPQGADWQNEKRSVAMILTAGGTRWCSGAMINNVRQDLVPYFLTANHCLTGSSNSWIFMFKYESPNCNIIDGPLNYTLSGSTLKASNSASDFALLQIAEAPPDSYEVHWSGWNRADVPATSGAGIHHPDGDIKKISFVSVPFEHDTWTGTPANSHWRTRWSAGVTEPGSSGSPIYDQNHRIMGQLHGGPSSCTASDKSDLYGKFSFSWDYGTSASTRLKDWLDPDNTGVMFLDGWDPSIGTPDTVPPTAITDLSVIAGTSNSLTLSWTAPSDTSYGGVKQYDVRVSTSPITDTTSFYTATRVPAPAPQAPGSTEQLMVKNLSPNTTYYFAIRSSDLWNNKSLLSNMALDTTLAPPVINVTPASITRVISTNSVLTDTIKVKNNSVLPSTLDYTVELANNTFPGKVQVSLAPLILNSMEGVAVKKEEPVTSGGQSIDGQGGPDAFGYKWIDSDEPNGPTYIWQDISSSGTAITNWTALGTGNALDDGYAGPFNLGFNFKFYGQVRQQVYIGTNGLLMFNQPSENNYSNTQLPTSAAPNELIAAFWDDLDGRTQGTVHYKQDGNKFIVQYTNWQRYSGNGSLTFQIVLYSSGKIYFYYNSLNATTMNSATIGLENQAGTVGLQVSYNTAYVHNNMAVKIAAEPDWLSTNNLGGTLYNGNSTAIVLNFRSEDFPAGQYRMDVKIASNDPVTPLVTVPVIMVIEGGIPVELTSFTANAIKNNVLLKWSTATETNNRGFSVERKSAGSQNWSPISFINGAGNSTEKHEYTFTDRSLSPGLYSYRIVQTDLDGAVTYYNAIEVEVGIPEEFSLEQNYPNPFNPLTKIEYSVGEKAHIKLAVYDMLGAEVSVLVNQETEPGYYAVVFNASSLPSGIYLYRLEWGNKSLTKKFTLTK